MSAARGRTAESCERTEGIAEGRRRYRGPVCRTSTPRREARWSPLAPRRVAPSCTSPVGGDLPAEVPGWEIFLQKETGAPLARLRRHEPARPENRDGVRRVSPPAGNPDLLPRTRRRNYEADAWCQSRVPARPPSVAPASCSISSSQAMSSSPSQVSRCLRISRRLSGRINRAATTPSRAPPANHMLSRTPLLTTDLQCPSDSRDASIVPCLGRRGKPRGASLRTAGSLTLLPTARVAGRAQRRRARPASRRASPAPRRPPPRPPACRPLPVPSR